jgi:hypothetical protein
VLAELALLALFKLLLLSACVFDEEEELVVDTV